MRSSGYIGVVITPSLTSTGWPCTEIFFLLAPFEVCLERIPWFKITPSWFNHRLLQASSRRREKSFFLLCMHKNGFEQYEPQVNSRQDMLCLVVYQEANEKTPMDWKHQTSDSSAPPGRWMRSEVLIENGATKCEALHLQKIHNEIMN